MSKLSDSSRDCLIYIVRSGLTTGFNRGDIPIEHSQGVHGLARTCFIKKNRTGDYRYTLTPEGWQYIRQQRLE